MRKLVRSLPAAALLLLAASPSRASTIPTPNAQDLSGTRALGMGDAFIAVASSNEAIYFNLAGLAQAHKYEIDLVYAFDPGNDLSRINGSIVDSKSTRLATGLAYTHLKGDAAQGEVSGSIAHLGFGVPLASRVAFGFGIKYLGFSDPRHANAVTGDLGLLIRPVDFISIGGAAYNVIDIDSPEAPRKLGAGIAVGTDTSFRLAFDTVWDVSQADTGIAWHAGGEYLFDDFMPIRAGFKRLEREDRNYVSGGFGFISDRAGIEFAYVQSLRKGESSDRIFSFTLSFFL
ncbi:hypothetical protein [Vulgatibacter incomptus]|uniref:PorV/PorQ family protein n=1 Tax=Vulgatibacter incomptus TaxID=1391653 RepID=A0A0K1PFA1_9BACT|nr:hypothetical protein [Vulgatibacter incomptus]AKU91784.1 hypothetical protein AKJ08_2171 [Vulgatibacter incomptus]